MLVCDRRETRDIVIKRPGEFDLGAREQQSVWRFATPAAFIDPGSNHRVKLHRELMNDLVISVVKLGCASVENDDMVSFW